MARRVRIWCVARQTSLAIQLRPPRVWLGSMKSGELFVQLSTYNKSLLLIGAWREFWARCDSWPNKMNALIWHSGHGGISLSLSRSFYVSVCTRAFSTLPWRCFCLLAAESVCQHFPTDEVDPAPRTQVERWIMRNEEKLSLFFSCA